MGGLPGGRLLGILNPNSAHSNTTWPPDATVAACVEPQAAHAGIAAPRSRHIASSDPNHRVHAPEPRRAAACPNLTTCVGAVPRALPSIITFDATYRTLQHYTDYTTRTTAPLDAPRPYAAQTDPKLH